MIAQDNNSISLSTILSNAKWITLSKKRKIRINNKSGSNLQYIPCPGRRWGHTSQVYDNKLIIFGGRCGFKCLSTLYCYSLESLSWNKIESSTPMPPTRDSHSSLIFNHEFVIFGGSGFGKKLNDMWKFSFREFK